MPLALTRRQTHCCSAACGHSHTSHRPAEQQWHTSLHPHAAPPTVATYLDGLLPSRLVEEMLHDAEIASETEFNKLTRAGRNKLVECLKGWRLGLVDDPMLAKGEVVAGGIALDEVDPQTMRSLKCPGLYLCGEALDVAGPVGGYNLQAAFSTGYVAGETAAGDLLG